MSTSLGHFPTDPAKFAFDADLAPVFDDMALRSIPGYAHAHDRMTRIARRNLSDLDWAGSQAWDFGCTTGAGVRSLYQAGYDALSYEVHACDVSRAMREMTRERCPWAFVHNHDLRQGLPAALDKGRVSVAVYAWTLQFILDIQTRRDLIAETYAALQPGGLLFIFEKWTPDDPLEYAEADYHWWRREQGYTQAEIDAKTKALASVMQPWRESDLIQAFTSARVDNFAQVYKMFNFGGYVVHKQM